MRNVRFTGACFAPGEFFSRALARDSPTLLCLPGSPVQRENLCTAPIWSSKSVQLVNDEKEPAIWHPAATKISQEFGEKEPREEKEDGKDKS